MVALFLRNPVFMGDTNQSRANFLKSVAKVVIDRIVEGLNEKQKQTELVRPCNIVADKDTTKQKQMN